MTMNARANMPNGFIFLEEPGELFGVGSTAAFHLETAQQLFASAEGLLILVPSNLL